MNEQQYNIQDIKAYLLGSLPETEAERFDEFSFTDNEFADVLKSAEKDLIDSYIQGELSGATLENFQSYYLASPLRREKVDFARAFQTFADQNVGQKIESSIFEESKSKQTSGGFFSSLNIFKNLNPILQFGFAAALLIVILGGLWVAVNRVGQPEIEMAKHDTPAASVEEPAPAIENKIAENTNVKSENARANENSEIPPQNSANEKTNHTPAAPRTPSPQKSPAVPKPIIASFILAPSLRGNRIQSLSIPKETSGVVMKLQLEGDDYAAYRVVLTNQSNKSIWQSGALKSKGNGESKFLNVGFPAKLLKSQIYSLQVSGIAADGASEIISDYPFRVVQ